MTQLTFDWPREAQLRVLERAILPTCKGVSAAAMKSVLRAIDSFGRGREAFPAESTLAGRTNLSIRTVRRAIRAMESASLLIVRRQGAMTLNHYRIVWTELDLLCQELCQEGPDMMAGRQAERPATVSERPATVSERPATVSERPATVSERPATVASKLFLKEIENNNNAVVVVSLLNECGLVDPQRTYSLATDSLRLTDEQITSRIATWRELPQERRSPGVLFNWLTKPRSYDATMSPNGQPAKLQFQKLANSADERRRADLVAYGRKREWSHEQMQAAVTKFENELLSQTQTMEPMPCTPQQF